MSKLEDTLAAFSKELSRSWLEHEIRVKQARIKTAQNLMEIMPVLELTPTIQIDRAYVEYCNDLLERIKEEI